MVNTPDWLNVMDYGATGSGITDDTAAIQSAITAAVTAVAGVVYLPAGKYLVSAPLRITAAICVIGDGREATTILLKSGTDDYAVKFTQASGAITGARFADFAINGNAANQNGGGGIGAVGAVQCSFERVWFTSCYNWGLALEGQPGGAFGHHNRIIGCTFDGAQAAGIGGGIWATSSDENFYYGCDFEYLGGVAAPPGAGDYPVALLDQAGLQQITSCCFVGSRGGNTQLIGVRVQNAASTRLIGCTFDGVGGDNVLIAGTDCVITGNEFSAIGDQCPTAGVSAGVHLEHGSLRTTVTANNFSSSPANGKTGWLIYEQQIGNSGSNVIEANTLRVTGTVANKLIETDGVASLVRSNIGYNPVGALKAPVIPASGKPLVNPFNVDCSVFLTGGTVKTVQISGVTTGLTSGQFLVNAGQSITLTYTAAAPSWTWIGNLPAPARPGARRQPRYAVRGAHREVPAMSGPADETAAGTGNLGHLRASRADREQAIDVLKTAFVQERLTKDEFDLRVGQVLASRTYAELAAVTADIPAGLFAAQPPRPPAPVRPRRPMGNAAKAGMCVAVAIAAAAVMTVATGGYALALIVPFYFLALLAAGAQMLATRHDKRSRGQLPPQRPAASTGGPHRPAAAKADQAPPIEQAKRRTAEATRSRLPRPHRAPPHRARPALISQCGHLIT